MLDTRFGRDPHSVTSSCHAPLEVWGGVEYTCNRVRSRYFDQMDMSGHALRPGDYELFARWVSRTLPIWTSLGALRARPLLDVDGRAACVRHALRHASRSRG